MKHKSYMEFGVIIDYDYSPAEPAVMYPNERAYPGAHEEVTINSVTLGGEASDILDGLDILAACTAGEIESFEMEILEYENTPPEER